MIAAFMVFFLSTWLVVWTIRLTQLTELSCSLVRRSRTLTGSDGPPQEFTYPIRDNIAVFLECEVASIEQVKLEVFEVALVRVRASRGKDLVLLAPDDQGRRPVLAKVRLPAWADRGPRTRVVSGGRPADQSRFRPGT